MRVQTNYNYNGSSSSDGRNFTRGKCEEEQFIPMKCHDSEYVEWMKWRSIIHISMVIHVIQYVLQQYVLLIQLTFTRTPYTLPPKRSGSR